MHPLPLSPDKIRSKTQCLGSQVTKIFLQTRLALLRISPANPAHHHLDYESRPITPAPELLTMPPGSQCLAAMARLRISSVQRPLVASITAPVRQTVLPSVSQVRYASGKPTKKSGAKGAEKKKKLPKQFRAYNPTDFPQFSVCDALRYALNISPH